MRDETNFLTKEQYQAFIDAIPKLEMYHNEGFKKPKLRPETLQLLFKVIYEAALRVSEAINLKPENILLDRELLELESTKGNKKRGKAKYRSDGTLIHNAAGKREFATLTTSTFQALKAYSQQVPKGERLFPLSRQTVYKLCRQAGDLAGIKLIHENKDTECLTIHTLRHSRAVHFLAAGQSINVVQKKLRHTTLGPTSTYTNINLDKLKEVEDEI